MVRLRFLALIWLTVLCLVPPAVAADGVRSFDSAGTPISYVIRGAGTPVILVHGFTASWQLNWQAPGIIEALAKEHRVVALDCRGHGHSGKPHAPEAYGEEMVRDVVRLMDHLGIERAQVVGYSMGAMISMKLAALYPDRVNAVVPCGAGYISRHDRRWRTVFGPLPEDLGAGRGLGRLIAYLRPAGLPPLSAEALASASERLIGMNDPQALAACMHSLRGVVPSRRQLRKCRVPGLAIVGDKDPMRGDVEAVARLAPNVELAVVPGANHMDAFMKPAFLETLAAFLRVHAGAEEQPESRAVAVP